MSSAPNPRGTAELPKPGPKTLWSPDKVIEHVEAHSRAIMTAVNDRIFDPTHPIYAAVSPGYRCLGGVAMPPSTVMSAPTSPRPHLHVSNSSEPAWIDFATFLFQLSRLVRSWPTYRIRVEDLNSSVEMKKGIAQVFVNCVVEGRPEGVVRSTMTRMEWQRVVQDDEENPERWHLINSKSMSGPPTGGASSPPF